MSLRSLDAQAEDEGDDVPSALGQEKGGVIIGCSECGSHWTIVDGDVIAVYLDGKLGERILSLSSVGTFRRAHWRGWFQSYEDGPADGYTIRIEPSVDAEDELGPEPLALALEDAVLRVRFEGVFVDVRLKYVENDAGHFGTPPGDDWAPGEW